MKSPKGYLTWQDVFGRVFIGAGGGASPVDKSQLISIIEYWDTSSGEYPPENYTPESYQAVLDAYAVAVAVRDNEEATQEEIDTAYLNLLNAIEGLEEVPIEPEDCVYPLDVSQEQLGPLGLTTFDVLDSCYNKFSNPTYKDSGEPYSRALRKEYVDALMIGADVPSEYLIPRGQAFEVVFRWDSEDKINGDIGVIELFGDGSLMGGAIRVISSLKDSEVVAEIQQIDGSSIDIVPQVGFEELRFGVLYEDGVLTVKSNIANDVVMAVDWDYLGMFISQNTPALKMTFDFITKAKDLTFTYPEGAVGLDGKPAPNQSQPDPTPTTIGEFIGGGYYIGNINIDAEDWAIIMAPEDAEITAQWKTTNTGTTGSTSWDDGLANTLVMQAAGIEFHPAAEHCVNYNGGGFSDWYLPAANELNLAWINLESLGSLNMIDDWYWASNQSAANRAIVQTFVSGATNNRSKIELHRVRPVRRIKL